MTRLATVALEQSTLVPGKPGLSTRDNIAPDDVQALSDAIERAVFRFTCASHSEAVRAFAALCLETVVTHADDRHMPATVIVRSDDGTMPGRRVASVAMRVGSLASAAWSEYWHSPSPERFVRTDVTTLRAAEHFGVSLETLCEATLDRVRRGVNRIRTGLKGETPCFENLGGNRVRSRFDAGDGMTWDGERLVTRDMFPETMRMAMKGTPASLVTGHPAFRDDRQIIGRIAVQPTRTMIMLKGEEILLDEQGRRITFAEAKDLGGIFRSRKYERKEKP